MLRKIIKLHKSFNLGTLIKYKDEVNNRVIYFEKGKIIYGKNIFKILLDLNNNNIEFFGCEGFINKDFVIKLEEKNQVFLSESSLECNIYKLNRFENEIVIYP